MEPNLTESAKKMLAELIRLLENHSFNGEIKIVAHQGGVVKMDVTHRVNLK